jgi:uncharacterized protein involved in exopolysaccharide biosynthesis
MLTTQRDSHLDARLKDYLKVLRKHRWMITAVFLVTVASVAIFTFTQVPIYQASATVQIEPDNPQVLQIQEVMRGASGSQDYYGTQHKLISSRPIVMNVVEKLNLAERIPHIGAAKSPYGAFLGSLRVDPLKTTRLVLVKFEDPDPVLAAEVANALASEYVKYNLDLKLKAARDALGWLNQQMSDLRGKVQESSTALQNYRVKANILGVEEQRRITAQKIMDFNRAYLEAQAQRLSVEAKLREITRIAKDRSGAETIFTVANDPLIAKLKAEASDLQVQRSKLIQIYKEKHPEVLKVDAQIQQVSQRIDAEIRKLVRAVETEYQVARAREQTLEANVNQLRREAQGLNEKEIGYLALQRESDSNQQLYEAVLKRLKETGVTSGLDTNNVRVVEAASPPRLPVKPRTTLNMALGVAVGLALGVGVAFLLESFDSSLRSPEDVERALGLPVLGIVPIFEVRR